MSRFLRLAAGGIAATEAIKISSALGGCSGGGTVGAKAVQDGSQEANNDGKEAENVQLSKDSDQQNTEVDKKTASQGQDSSSPDSESTSDPPKGGDGFLQKDATGSDTNAGKTDNGRAGEDDGQNTHAAHENSPK